MSPDEILAALGRRYDVPSGYGSRFRPLIRRALEAGPEVRERILALVETSFGREQERHRGRQRAHSQSDEWRAVKVVARVLHAWSPPEWLVRWGEGPPGPHPEPGS